MPTPGRRFKDAIYDQFELLELLAQGPRTVEALGRMADMSLANTSAHLQVLRGAGLVEASKEGLYVTYRLADDRVAHLFLALRRRVRRGEVTLLDVRPQEEFRAAHIPGALSVPLPELARRLSGLPRKREVVAYCRGPYCVL